MSDVHTIAVTHGQPFLQNLCEVPQDVQEAREQKEEAFVPVCRQQRVRCGFTGGEQEETAGGGRWRKRIQNKIIFFAL